MRTITLLSALFVFIISFQLHSQTYSPSDSLALLSIDALCDSSNQLNWNTEPDPGKWDGVSWSLDNPKKVNILQLFGKGLKGNLNVSALSGLKQLFCGGNAITGLNASSIISLDSIECFKNFKLTNLNLSGSINLSYLICSGNQLTELDITGLNKLTYLDCFWNQLTNLNVSGLDKLTYLECSQNQLTNLNVSGLKSLVYLYCNQNQLTSLNVSGLTNLLCLKCASNQLSSLSMASDTSMTYLNCSNNNLTNLTFSQLKKLDELYCEMNKLPFSSLDSALHMNYFYYDPQDTIFNPLTIAGTYTIDYSSEAVVADSITHFVFYKNDTLIEYNFNGKFTTIGPGVYNCNMTNGKFPGLVLTTAKISVTSDTPVLSVSPSTLHLDVTASDMVSFHITSNAQWSIASTESWLTLSKESGINDDTITLLASVNPNATERNASIIVSATGVTPKVIEVSQDGLSTGISSVNYINATIYPCPVIDIVKVKLTQTNLPSLISIFTLDGKQLLQMKARNAITEINIENYLSGIYILKIKSSQQTIEEKIIKH
jgi:hypothetical protein